MQTNRLSYEIQTGKVKIRISASGMLLTRLGLIKAKPQPA